MQQCEYVVGRDEEPHEDEDGREIGECGTDEERHDGSLHGRNDDDYGSEDQRHAGSLQGSNDEEHDQGRGAIHGEHRECSSEVTPTRTLSPLKCKGTTCERIEEEVDPVDEVDHLDDQERKKKRKRFEKLIMEEEEEEEDGQRYMGFMVENEDDLFWKINVDVSHVFPRQRRHVDTVLW